MADDLLNLTIETWRTGTYGPGYDPAVFAQQLSQLGGGDAPAGAIGGAAGSEALPVTDSVTIEATRAPQTPSKAFVPPVLPLPVAAPLVTTAAAPAAGGVLAGLAAAAGTLIGLFMPKPTAPRELDEPRGKPRVIPQPQQPVQFGPEPQFEVEITSPPRRPTAPPRTLTPAPPDWWTPLRFEEDPLAFSYPFPGPGWYTVTTDLPGSNDDRTGDAGSNPLPIGDPALQPLPQRRARPGPSYAPAPYLPGAPQPYEFGDFPIGLPSPEPLARPRVAPRPAPAPDLSPFPFGDVEPTTTTVPRTAPRTPTASPLPFDPTAPFLPDPINNPQLVPQLAVPLIPATPDTCTCSKPRKKPKKRKPRTECRRGTYVQTARGISYTPKEIVPCR